MKNNVKKRKKRRKNTGVILLIFVIFILMCYLHERHKYEDVFCKDTIINGEDCSLLTIEQAKQLIQNKQDQYVLEISFKDNEIETITGTQIGLTIESLEEELNGIKERQRKKIFLTGGIYNLEKYSYNEDSLRTELSSKKQLQPDYMEEKTEVEYEYNPDSKHFEVKNQNIYNLDFNEVFEQVSNAIEKGKKSISLEDLYLISDNTTLNELNSFISAEITYKLPDNEEYVLDADTLHTWLIQDEKGNYKKDERTWNENVKEFVEEKLKILAETVQLEREFKPTGKDYTIFVNPGNYGYLLDTTTEIQELKKELENQKVVTREPYYLKEEVESDENYGLGESYVEIDLTRQKVWVYIDGNLEVETDCVTGCVNKGYETPTGIFTLTYKETDRVLRGKKLPNGRYEYESHVDYWMPFNRGIGLHDATWRKTFGGDIYIKKGSHGCINLPANEAKKIYYLIDTKIPIIVYKSE